MDQNREEAVARLWDDLADYDAVQTLAACRHLMAALADMVRAQNAGWVGAMRTGAGDPSDLLCGWRIGAVEYLNNDAVNTAAVAGMKTRWATREVDPLSLHSLHGAGEVFRFFTLRQAMAPEWFERPYYKSFFEPRGIHDALFAFFPLNEDAESVFVLHAGHDRGDFDPDTVALATRVLRGIKWFHRRLMLAHGLLIASSPLTPAERRVAAELLSEATEKEIARRLDLAPSTVHQYITGLYRKFGVKGRAGLMSIWLNRV